MRRLARSAGLAVGGGAVMFAAAFALTPAAGAATTVPASFDCQARPPIGSPQQITMPNSVQADAPSTVTAGSIFEVTLAFDELTVPSDAGGKKVNNLRNAALKLPVPAGSTFQGAKLTGGSNLGSGTPTVSQADGVVTVTVPGPLAGGSKVTLPTLTLTLTASGAPGSTIETRLAGASYADPGLTFTANVKAAFLNIDVPTTCFANPSPTFTTTTIEAAPAS